jgi:subtilisin family serine protease
VAPNRILVGFKPQTTNNATEIIAVYGGEIIDKLGEGNEYVVQLPPNAETFDVINDITKYAEVDYAEPDFVTIGSHVAQAGLKAASGNPGPGSGDNNPGNAQPDEPVEAGPAAPGNDPFLQFQYAARITQAVQAWQFVSGSPAIRIAILDEGVDALHPELRSAIVASFDAVEGDVDQQPRPWDSHGTACAGLAAAIPNNNVGVRGIGGGCSLMPVRIPFSANPNDNWTWVEANVVRGIDWAWKNGADVLSNSWVGGAPSAAIMNALERARRFGRQGRGCLVVMAAGNDSGPVAFPANLPNVLAISASNEFDEPKTKTSADGETWWGSNFGPEVDLAAPGVHNFTTDIVGADGDNPGGAVNADYMNNFNGTSSSTPIVAGVAGLVLSINPNLTEAQMRRLLTQTADKVGQVVYTNGRNNQMGQGRVNALRAVQAAPAFV